MSRSFAIVPAAGASVRMGAPKLLMPLGGRSIVQRVLSAWTASRVTRTIVVIRPGDAALLEACGDFDVDIVVPSAAPPDMKASVLLAIERIAESWSPAASDAWLLAPADMPRLSTQAIDAALQAYDPDHPCAVAPTFAGRRGHPLVMPWPVAAEVARLPWHEGVNALAARTPIRETPWTDDSILHDVDTPADMARVQLTPI